MHITTIYHAQLGMKKVLYINTSGRCVESMWHAIAAASMNNTTVVMVILQKNTDSCHSCVASAQNVTRINGTSGICFVRR